MAFTSPSSTGAEGDVLTICLAVVSGEIATPTNVTLTTLSFLPGSGGIIIDGGQGVCCTATCTLVLECRGHQPSPCVDGIFL